MLKGLKKFKCEDFSAILPPKKPKQSSFLLENVHFINPEWTVQLARLTNQLGHLKECGQTGFNNGE